MVWVMKDNTKNTQVTNEEVERIYDTVGTYRDGDRFGPHAAR